MKLLAYGQFTGPIWVIAACTVFQICLDPSGRRIAHGWKLNMHKFPTWDLYAFGLAEGQYVFPYGPAGLMGPMGTVQAPRGPARLIVRVFASLFGIHKVRWDHMNGSRTGLWPVRSPHEMLWPHAFYVLSECFYEFRRARTYNLRIS